MQAVAADGVAWSVCRSQMTVSLAKTAEPTEMSFGMWTWVGPGNRVLDGGPGPDTWRDNFEGKGAGPEHAGIVQWLIYSEWLSSGRNRYDADWGVTDCNAHWHHLANMIEPPLCVGSVALCQVTLTACFVGRLGSKFVIKSSLTIPPHLKLVAVCLRLHVSGFLSK